ncbi:MAG: ribonuclease P protein component [Candidatus Berkelbacteria bacterium]|nr:ribonuclease P protein component [Candidatus Berkelbacteria bacterium]
MIKKEQRVPALRIKKIYQKGQTRKSENITLRFFENHKQTSRFGFVVSKKAISKATKRNLIKRRSSEIVRNISDKIKSGYDYVLIFKKEIEFQELEKEIKEILNV